MMAFAANSLLNRAALADETISPGAFALVRVAAGVVMLVLIVAIRDRAIPRTKERNWIAVLGLAAYMLGFSYAYVVLDAGLGALILFGGVQITMFAGAVIEGQRPSAAKWIGMGLAMAGLALLFWPSEAVELPLVLSLIHI